MLVNPRVHAIGDETFRSYEGCLSVPDLRGRLVRPWRVYVSYWDRDGNPCEEEVSGLAAGTYQHECDHLDGVLFVDRVEDPTTFCTWQAFARYRRDVFVEEVTRLAAERGA